jgi:YbbR domain-containing protein
MNIINRLLKTEDRNYRHNVSVFVMCLIISTLVWLLTKFTYEYTSVVSFPLRYTGISENKIPVSSMDSTLNIAISGTGFSLLRVNYFNRKRPFDINIQNYQLQQQDGFSEVTIGTSLVAQQIIEQFSIPGQVEYVVPESLTLRFEEKVSKKVPVLSNVEMNFRQQYAAYDSLTVHPEYVEISGKVEQIGKIRFVKTVPVVLENLDASVDRSVEIVKPAHLDHFWVDPQQVRIRLQVERFTEARFEIPVQMINLPDNVRVKLFPEKVNVSFMVALKDYKDMNADMFSVIVDLSDILAFEGKRLNVELQDAPAMVKGVRIAPPDVEFLILK